MTLPKEIRLHEDSRLADEKSQGKSTKGEALSFLVFTPEKLKYQIYLA